MLMAALTPKAQALIEKARAEMQPPLGERARLEALLDAQLAATGPRPAARDPLPAPRANGWRLMTSLTVGVALVGGGALWALRPTVAHESTPATVNASAAPTPAAAIALTAPVV